MASPPPLKYVPMTDHDFSRWRPHPWHGLDLGADAPRIVNAYIEITPFDMIKYEIDKRSGLLKLDRPQRYSSLSPEPYGFVPRTLCGESVAAFAAKESGRSGLKGDGDPLDICVISERPIERSEVILRARVIGGIKLLDRGEADDKIIAVLESDPTYESWTELEHCPPVLIDRLQHYFLTYKDMPGSSRPRVEMAGLYGAETAREIIGRSQVDYRARFGDLVRMLDDALSDEEGV